jgi:hypothetical protein
MKVELYNVNCYLIWDHDEKGGAKMLTSISNQSVVGDLASDAGVDNIHVISTLNSTYPLLTLHPQSFQIISMSRKQHETAV